MAAWAATNINRQRLSVFIAERMGLHFPPERWSDLERGLTSAAKEFGFEGISDIAAWLFSASRTPTEYQRLASHLTVGETYFFRDRKTYDALAGEVFPRLIDARRNGERRLNLWSAGCCTGEEPYSLAMLLHQLVPDLKAWRIQILGTDINAAYLQKAKAGVYGEWSFRDAPEGIKERYFRWKNGRYALVPEIRNLVTFRQLNLAEKWLLPPMTQPGRMDLIVCRNVLMYFRPSLAATIIRQFHGSLNPDGWLLTSPSDAPQTVASFDLVNFPGAILHRRHDAPSPHAPKWSPALPAGQPDPWRREIPGPQTPSSNHGDHEPLIVPEEDGGDVACMPMPRAKAAQPNPLRKGGSQESLGTGQARGEEDAATHLVQTRSLANQGRLSEALASCDRWVSTHKLDPGGHYLRAMVLHEIGNRDQARRALQRVIYLQPDFVLAHFTLGNMDRSAGRIAEANRHFTHTLKLLRSWAPDGILPESDGMTAGRLTEITASILEGRETA